MLTVSIVDMKISGFLSKCLSGLRSCWERVKHPLWDCWMVTSCFSNKSFVIILLSWDIIADSFHVLITTQWDLKVQLKLFYETKAKWNIFNFNLLFLQLCLLIWIPDLLVYLHCILLLGSLRLKCVSFAPLASPNRTAKYQTGSTNIEQQIAPPYLANIGVSGISGWWIAHLSFKRVNYFALYWLMINIRYFNFNLNVSVYLIVIFNCSVSVPPF